MKAKLLAVFAVLFLVTAAASAQQYTRAELNFSWTATKPLCTATVTVDCAYRFEVFSPKTQVAAVTDLMVGTLPINTSTSTYQNQVVALPGWTGNIYYWVRACIKDLAGVPICSDPSDVVLVGYLKPGKVESLTGSLK